jgi:hypothetical protein
VLLECEFRGLILEDGDRMARARLSYGWTRLKPTDRKVYKGNRISLFVAYE